MYGTLLVKGAMTALFSPGTFRKDRITTDDGRQRTGQPMGYRPVEVRLAQIQEPELIQKQKRPGHDAALAAGLGLRTG